MAHQLTEVMPLVAHSTAWYLKVEVTFLDVVGFVRQAMWAEKYLDNSRVRR